MDESLHPVVKRVFKKVGPVLQNDSLSFRSQNSSILLMLIMLVLELEVELEVELEETQ